MTESGDADRYIDSVEQAQLELDCYTVQAIVEHLAKTNNYITYGELADAVGRARGRAMDPRGFASSLGRIQHYCDELDLPCLPVMVKYADNSANGPGFIECYRDVHPEKSSLSEAAIRKSEKDAALEERGWQKLYDYLDIESKAPTVENKFIAWEAARFYEEGTKIIEGSRVEVMRSREARVECLKLKGTTCLICGFSAKDVYGENAHEIIEVHHLDPLGGGAYDERRSTDPEKDLIPVCPNCHAIIHSKNVGKRADCYTPDEVREMLNRGL